MPQEQDGKVVTQQHTRKASQGWKNGKLQLGSWMSTGESTEDGWRPQVRWFGCRPLEEHIHKAEGRCLYPLKLMDSEPKEECCHSLNWVKAGKADQMERGVKQESIPMFGWRVKKVYNSDAKCSYLPRGTYSNYGGMVLYPSKQPSKSGSQPKRQSMRSCSFKQWGCVHMDPLKQTIHLTINRDSHRTHSKLIKTVVNTHKRTLVS